jgi:hypothetical protein
MKTSIAINGTFALKVFGTAVSLAILRGWYLRFDGKTVPML